MLKYKPRGTNCMSERGMTLIETLVAVTILSVAIVAPMSLTIQSLFAAYYARDQVIASNLAQEAIESVRSIRDSNILRIAMNIPDPTCTPTDLMCGIPVAADFMIDTRNNEITRCDADGTAACDPLQIDPTQTFYGYGSGWTSTSFLRVVRVEFVDPSFNEIRVIVTVSKVDNENFPAVRISENLYRWIDDGSGV